MPATVNLAFELTPGGLDQAQAELDRIRALLESGRTPSERVPGEVVYRKCQDGKLGQKLLEALPEESDALKFEDLAERIKGSRDKKARASLRAAHRNVKQVEEGRHPQRER